MQCCGTILGIGLSAHNECANRNLLFLYLQCHKVYHFCSFCIIAFVATRTLSVISKIDSIQLNFMHFLEGGTCAHS